MVFSSIEFIFRFLPLFFIIYFLTPKQYRNVSLLLGSLFFYAYGEPIYIFLMILSIFVNYVLAQNIVQDQGCQHKSGKRWLIIALVYNLGMLFVFKYLHFFLEIISKVTGREIALAFSLTLPLGISFYTFQILSYMIDVYRGKYEAERNLLYFATYVCMFPQLIAGPIVNYSEVRKQMPKREANYKNIEWGTMLFIFGLSYKVLLANKIGSLWNDVQTIGPLGINAPTAWLGSWGFSMQIYFDFFGYSLMAIGLGKMLGFHFPKNFDNPYCVKSATTFWRKWHITLGRWFREYVYIPLGGNRRGIPKQIINLFIVWSLTGLWHGANWNFVIWGLFYFVILLFEKLFLYRFLEKSHILGHLYMMILIPVSWTIFNITNLPVLVQYLKTMFGIPLEGKVAIDGMAKFTELFSRYGWLLLICAICCTPYPFRLMRKFYKTAICKGILFVLFWYCVYQILLGGNNPFLYFRF